MSPRYQLTCPRCNRSLPIETSQAGQTLPCECGESLRVPTMLKIKRLPLWGGDALTAPASPTAAPSPVASPTPTPTPAFAQAPLPNAASPSTASPLSGARWGLFAVASIFTIVAAFFFCCALRVPDPIAVFYKQIEYANDGKIIRRDSSPIEPLDYSFYFLNDPLNNNVYLVNDRLIDDMSFFHTYHYLDSVQKLEMSDNFYENYNALKLRRAIFCSLYGVATLCSAALALFALFAPQKRAQVGATRGDSWR